MKGPYKKLLQNFSVRTIFNLMTFVLSNHENWIVLNAIWYIELVII